MQNTGDHKGAGTYLHAHRFHGMLLPVPSTNVHANPPTIASLCWPHPATTATCKRRAVLFPVSWCVTGVADVICRHHAVLLPVPWRVTDVTDIVYRHRLQCSMFTSIPSLFNTAACNACKRRAVFFPMPWHVTGVADVICRQRLRRSIILSISSVLLALPPSEACDRHPASASRHDEKSRKFKKGSTNLTAQEWSNRTWPNTRVVKWKYCVAQKRDKAKLFNFSLTFKNKIHIGL